MRSLVNRITALEAQRGARPCSDPWHPRPIVMLNEGDPEPPGCPSCGEKPFRVVVCLSHERDE